MEKVKIQWFPEIRKRDERKREVVLCSFMHWTTAAAKWLQSSLWTVVLQAPLSMGFSRQEYWSE